MAGLFDDLQEVSLTTPPPRAPKPPAGLFDDLQEIRPPKTEPLPARGFVEHVKAGFQASAPGLAWRGKLPELVMNPDTSDWWERLATGVTQVVSELPIMIPAGAAGAAAGAPAGPVGSILGGGAAMFAAPAGIRTSLMEAYKAREATTPVEWFSIVKEVAKSMAHEGAIGAATFGAGALARGGLAAAMGGSAEVARAVGLGTATMATKGTAAAATTADLAAQIAAMVTLPAAMEGRLPEMREFGDAAAVILTLKGAHVALERTGVLKTVADRVANVYERTGRTPAEQLADAQADPKIAAELTGSPETTGTSSGVPLKLDRLIAEAEVLARGEVEVPKKLASLADRAPEVSGTSTGTPLPTDRLIAEATYLADPIPEAPRIRDLLKDLQRKGVETDVSKDVEQAVADVRRLTEIEVKASERPARTIDTPEGKVEIPVKRAESLTDAEKSERDALRARIAEIEGRLKDIPSASDFEASANKVYNDVFKRLSDQARERAANGLPAIDYSGKPPEAIAGVVAENVRTFAKTEGRLPEDIYREYFPSFTDASRVAREKPARETSPKEPPAPKVESVLQAIRRKGGIDIVEISDLTGESKAGKGRKGIPVGLFHKNGKTLDDLATELRAEEGFDIPVGEVDGGVARLREMISDEIQGHQKHYSFDDQARLSTHERELEYRSDLELQKIEAAEREKLAADVKSADLEPTAKNITDADLVAKAMEKDPDAVERAAIQFTEDDAAFMVEIRRIYDQNRETAEGGAENRGSPGEKVGDELYQSARKAQIESPEMEGMSLFQNEAQKNEGVHLASYQVNSRLISTFENANSSSVLHELGHHFLEMLRHFAAKPEGSARTKEMWMDAKREFAIPDEGPIPAASHETWAKMWERYLGEGEAPTPKLKAMFDQFKEWMLRVYNDIKNIVGVDIKPEVRRIFDRLLATDEEIADAKSLNVPRAYVAEARQNEARKIVPGFKAEQVALEPYADELPKGPGEAPNNSHVNYATLDSQTAIKLTLQRLAEIDQQNIQKQRGGKAGVETWKDEQIAMENWINDTLGGGQDKLGVIRGGSPDDPKVNHMLRAKKQMMLGAGHESERLRDVILQKGHNATIEEQLQYLSSIELLRQLHVEFLGERAAVARAMNALKDTTGGSAAVGNLLEAMGREQTLFQSPAEKALADQAMLKAKLDEILLRYNGKTVLDIAKLHKEIGTLKGTFKLAEGLEKATTWEKFVEFWKNGLLSGPQTPVTNFLGTWSFQALRPAVDAVAAATGMMRGAKVGDQPGDRLSLWAPVLRVNGMLKGVQAGAKAAAATFRADEATQKVEAYKNAIPGRFGEIVRLPYRLLGAGDAMVSTMYKYGELEVLAGQKAIMKGHHPMTREFAIRRQEIIDNPDPAMLKEAEDVATRMTFNDPGGERTRMVQGFVNKWHLQWMVPFIRTPLNIAAEMIRMSPAAPLVDAWRADIAKGGVARDRALAEVAVGAGIMAITMAYAFDGLITGSGDPDPGKRRSKTDVWQPNSVKIGDTYYEIGRLQPGGTLMVLAADVANAWDHMTDEEKDKVPKILAMAFSNAITNQTFLQGLTNVIHMMSEPDRYGKRFFEGLAGSLVPNIIGQPTAMSDPYVRQVNSMLEAIQARTPMRQALEPKQDWLGEPVKNKERLGVVLPIRETKISDDKVRKEADRLNISVADTPKKVHIGRGTGKIGDVELTPEERNNFAKIGGDMAHKILGEIVNQSGYDQIPDMIKRKMFANVLSRSHQVAAVMALPPEKRDAYLQTITEKVAVQLSQ